MRVSDPIVGRVLDGRYRVDELVARGGMATVYHGLDVRLDRQVAIKVMHGHYAEDADFVARFGREARAAARLNNPGVVAVYDQGEDAGCVFLIMEYVAGHTLRDLLHQQGRLSAAQALDVMEPVLAALAAAHTAGIVHRDVKPENVLLADDGRIKVADFGLARAFSAGTATRTQGVILGTMAYLSPEQVQQDGADARSDVYAAGVMLYELLTGKAPFIGDSPINVAFQHVNTDVPPPSAAVPGIHPAVDALVVRATRRDPDQRPADAGRLLAAVREVRRTVPTADLGPAPNPRREPTVALSAPRTSPTTLEPVVALPDTSAATPRKGPGAVGGPAEVPRGAKRRRWWVILIVLLVLVGLGSGAGYGTWWETTGQWVRTPAVVGEDQHVATSKLTAAGLKWRLGDPKFSELTPAGQVMSTDPGPKTRVHKHATVTLVVSKGKERFTVPDVTNKTVAVARSLLAKNNLALGKQTLQYDDTVPKGVIISASLMPSDGQQKRGTAVAVAVSRGPQPIDVPDLTGAQGQDATDQLNALGLKVVEKDVYSDIPVGQVVTQKPRTGTLFKGGLVRLTVSKGPQLFLVPGVTGKNFSDAKAIVEAAGFVVKRQDLFGGILGIVRFESPGGNSMKPKGTVVTLTVI
jgi:beta-lactam-binding protein with PASTA domain/predicted Ser/Thr protein kinase